MRRAFRSGPFLAHLALALGLGAASGCSEFSRKEIRGRPRGPISHTETYTAPYPWTAKGNWGIGVGILVSKKSDPVSEGILADVNYTYQFTRFLAVEAKVGFYSARLQTPFTGTAVAGMAMGTFQLGNEFPRGAGRYYVGLGAGGFLLDETKYGRNSDWGWQVLAGARFHGRGKISVLDIALEVGYMRMEELPRDFKVARLNFIFNF